MSLREEMDLAEVVDVVVRPALQALLRPGELDSVSLGWAPVRIPAWSRPEPDYGATVLEARQLSQAEYESLPWAETIRLVVELRIKGESFSHEIADASETDAVDLQWQADELYSCLQDFIAESKFGWGELRERPME